MQRRAQILLLLHRDIVPLRIAPFFLLRLRSFCLAPDFFEEMGDASLIASHAGICCALFLADVIGEANAVSVQRILLGMSIFAISQMSSWVKLLPILLLCERGCLLI